MGRWLAGQSKPPRRAIRRLAETLRGEDIEAEHLISLWNRAFAPAAQGPAGTCVTDEHAVRPDLAAALGRGLTELAPAVEEACAAGVLAKSGTALKFRHPLIRAALYEEMPAPLRAAWHHDVGRALAAAGAPPDRVARQLLWAVNGAGDAAARAGDDPGGRSERAADPGAWMLPWLIRNANLLAGQAPGVTSSRTRVLACVECHQVVAAR